MHISRKHKRNIGKHEACGLVTKGVDSAHIKGKERPKIIANILSQFQENELYELI
jgi:hypothetical protein